MKNSLHQIAFLNAPESERIFPTSVGNFAVQNPYSIPVNVDKITNVYIYNLTATSSGNCSTMASYDIGFLSFRLTFCINLIFY